MHRTTSYHLLPPSPRSKSVYRTLHLVAVWPHCCCHTHQCASILPFSSTVPIGNTCLQSQLRRSKLAYKDNLSLPTPLQAAPGATRSPVGSIPWEITIHVLSDSLQCFRHAEQAVDSQEMAGSCNRCRVMSPRFP